MPGMQVQGGLPIGCLLLLLCFQGITVGSPRAAWAQTDVFISSLTLRAPVGERDADTDEDGGTGYEEIVRYDPQGAAAPDTADVLVMVNGRLAAETRVVLEIFPVVGLTNWAQTGGVTELQLLHASKTRLASVYRQSKGIILSGRTGVFFSRIDLHGLVSRYAGAGFWPVELVFRACVDPVPGETSLSNNVMERTLPVMPPS